MAAEGSSRLKKKKTKNTGSVETESTLVPIKYMHTPIPGGLTAKHEQCNSTVYFAIVETVEKEKTVAMITLPSCKIPPL